jgi:hypothetical protein
MTKKIASKFHEIWTCGSCGRSFGDATSCCAHESQCGGRFSHC